MPNLDLQGKTYPIKDATVKDYFGGNEEASYEYMKKVKSEIDNKQVKEPNDELVLKWIDSSLNKDRDKIDNVKRTIMQTDGQGKKKGGNAYKDTHEKDRDNANPTAVGGVPQVHKGSMRRKVMTGKEVYESIDKEIEAARYLIEYMNNNNKTI